MKILLTNDDGVFAQGLQALHTVLTEEHDVFIIAPDNEKSACSNAITTRSRLIVTKLKDGIFSVSGFPADCVNIGLNGNIIPDIDLVISGINHGPNIGNDVIFSGTVAGARTAYVFGKTGISISLDSYHKPSDYYKDASRFILEFISANSKELLDGLLLLNINYPDISADSIQGVMYTHLGKRIYKDHYKKEELSETESSMVLDGTFEYIHEDGSDVAAVKNGFVSITPLSIDCTDVSYLMKRKTRM